MSTATEMLRAVLPRREGRPTRRTEAGGEALRIAQVSPYDYPFPGGVTEHIASLAAALSLRGHDVRILAPSSADAEQLDVDHVYRLGSIVRVPYHGSWARTTLSLGLSRKVQAVLQRERFDIIHVHEPLLPLLAPRVLLTPGVGHEHTVTAARRGARHAASRRGQTLSNG
jgi:phosphatidyl-myo-inositol alpha-mannosyltransferase